MISIHFNFEQMNLKQKGELQMKKVFYLLLASILFLGACGSKQTDEKVQIINQLQGKQKLYSGMR